MNSIHSSPHAGLRARFRIFVLLLLLALLFIPLVGVMLFVVEIEDAVYCNGVVVPDEYYEVVSHLNARVTKLNFRTGDEVKQGDVIAELDSLTYENDALGSNPTRFPKLNSIRPSWNTFSFRRKWSAPRPTAAAFRTDLRKVM